MNKITDLMDLKNNSPFIKIMIAETEVEIQVFFSMNCCKVFFECRDNGDSFRTAFAKSIFHMYKQEKSNEDLFTENDFIGITDTELILILDTILAQDNRVKLEYEKIDCPNVYEKFYIANKEVLKSATAGISMSLKRMSRTFELQNKPLITSISSAISNIVVPTESLSGLASTASKMTHYDFTSFQSVLNSVPKLQLPELTTVLSNIPKPIFDIQTIFYPLHNMMENLHSINDNLAHRLHDSIMQMSEVTQKIISSIDFSLLIYRKEWSEQRETLLRYGWFYSDELPEELVNSIHIKREELSIEDVDKIIVDYFRQNRCEALKKMVKRWETLDYFHCRERIFHEALVNHSRKYYNSSVTLLTIHTEGIITDFVRTNLKNPRFKVQKAIEDIKIELNEKEDVSIYEFEVYSDVIERIEEAFNENFNHADPDTASNKSRHKIAHGHAYEIENEVNSLKRFLYLNEIHCLFSRLSNLE
jgi:hypothetical protein